MLMSGRGNRGMGQFRNVPDDSINKKSYHGPQTQNMDAGREYYKDCRGEKVKRRGEDGVKLIPAQEQYQSIHPIRDSSAWR